MENKYDFESQRLGFRQWTKEDKIPFAKINADPEVMEFFPSTLNRQQSDEMVDRMNNNFEKNGFGLWAVEIKETGKFIGLIGLEKVTFEAFFTPCIEIGWRLGNKYWNKGYATEGAKACLKYGFDVLRMEEIYSFTAQINTRSSNVMEKIGMRQVGRFDHPKVDLDSHLKEHVLYKIEGTRR